MDCGAALEVAALEVAALEVAALEVGGVWVGALEAGVRLVVATDPVAEIDFVEVGFGKGSWLDDPRLTDGPADSRARPATVT